MLLYAKCSIEDVIITKSLSKRLGACKVISRTSCLPGGTQLHTVPSAQA